MTKKVNSNWDDIETCEYNRVRVDIPYISISPRNTITFSKGFRNISKNDSIKYVKILYSASNSCILFDFFKNIPENNNKGFYMISKKLFCISSKSFFNHFRLNIDKIKGKYISKFEEIPELGKKWVIYLDKKIKMGK